MKKYLILFLLLKSVLFGCSLCSIYSPRTHISTHVIADDTHIKTINIKWTFAKQFSDQLLAIYDLNMDGTFDDKELQLIEDALTGYISTKNFLTTITYDNKKDGQAVPFEVKNYKMDYKNEILSFQYEISLDYKIYDKNFLKINIFDNEGYFFIVFEDAKQKFNIPYKVVKDTNISEVTYKIIAPSLPVQKDKLTIEEMKLHDVVKETKFKNDSPNNNGTYLDSFTNNVKKYLVEIENGNKTALIFLLLASFFYGLVHAIGPGHGKSLAFSYFATQKSSYLKAFIISLFTAFIHIAGALIVVLVSMVILKSVLNNFVENSITYTTALSSIIIILLALYILYKKIKKKKHVCNLCGVKANEIKFSSTLKQSINYLKPSKIEIPKKRTKTQDLIFVLCAGIIPCPGTVFLFIYAFLLKTYFAVILSSIFISLGMAVVIFCSSALSVSMHKVSSKSSKIVNILEIIAPIFMIILAILLFLSTNIV